MTRFAPIPPADPLPGHRLRLEHVVRAATLIDPVFLNTPQFNCEPLSEALACALTLKLETANPIRSFKGRGAGYLVASRATDGSLKGRRVRVQGRRDARPVSGLQCLGGEIRARRQRVLLDYDPHGERLIDGRWQELVEDPPGDQHQDRDHHQEAIAPEGDGVLGDDRPDDGG